MVGFVFGVPETEPQPISAGQVLTASEVHSQPFRSFTFFERGQIFTMFIIHKDKKVPLQFLVPSALTTVSAQILLIFHFSSVTFYQVR